MTRRIVKPRRLDFYQDEADHVCGIMLLRGRSNKAIMKVTGLTQSQIQYRATRISIKRGAYRDGTSPFAKQADIITAKLAEKAIYDHLDEYYHTKYG